MDECSDAEKVWYPQRTVCRYSMDLAAANWKYDRKHEALPYHDGTFPEEPSAWAKDRSSSHPYHYRDGVGIWLYGSDLNPEDQFL